MAKKDKKPTSLKDINPFKLQSTLVKQAGLTSKYTGGDMSTTYGEVDVNKMMDPMKEALASYMGKKESDDKKCTDEQKEACVKPKVLNKDCKCVDAGSGDVYNIAGDYIAGTGDVPRPGPDGPPDGPTDGPGPSVDDECDCDPDTDLPDCDDCPGTEEKVDCDADPTGDGCECDCDQENPCAEYDGDRTGVWKNGECECSAATNINVMYKSSDCTGGKVINANCECVCPQDKVEYEGECVDPDQVPEEDKCECNPDFLKGSDECKKCEEDKKKKTTKKDEKKDEEEDDCPGTKLDPPTHEIINGNCKEIDYVKKMTKHTDNIVSGSYTKPDGVSEKDWKKYLKSLEKETTTEPNITRVVGFDRDSKVNQALGGYQGKIVKKQIIKNGSVKEIINKSDGPNYDISYKIVTNGVTFNPEFHSNRIKKNIKSFNNFKKDGNYTVAEWNNFVDEYDEAVGSASRKLYQFNQKVKSELQPAQDEMKQLAREIPDIKKYAQYPSHQIYRENLEKMERYLELQKVVNSFTKTEDLVSVHGFTYKELAALQLHGRSFKAIKIDSEPLGNYKDPSAFKHPASEAHLKDFQGKERPAENFRHHHKKNKDVIWVNNKYSDEEVEKILKDEKSIGGIMYKSPFTRRSRAHLNVRKDWTPNKQVPQQEQGMMGQGMPGQEPMMYRSPLHQEPIEEPIEDSMMDPTVPTPEEEAGIGGQEVAPQGETIWDKMEMYGGGIQSQVEKFVSNATFNPQINKPIEAIQNQEWVGTITDWLKEKKSQLVEAKKAKNNKLVQEINQHVNTLIQDVSSLSNKFLSWLERNGGDKTPGNKGGNVTSEGSLKDERFVGDLVFIGDTNTDMAIDDQGKMGIKSYGLDDLRRVDELDNGVFSKDFVGQIQVLKLVEQVRADAESGKSKTVNENIIKGQADMLINSDDSLLSWAHDAGLFGQAWIQDYAQGNPNEDLSWAMPESDQYDKERLEDEVHGWLTDKLLQVHIKNSPKEVRDAETIHQETMASIEGGGYSPPPTSPSPNQPPQQEVQQPQGAMAYKSRAIKLIEKYS